MPTLDELWRYVFVCARLSLSGLQPFTMTPPVMGLSHNDTRLSPTLPRAPEIDYASKFAIAVGRFDDLAGEMTNKSEFWSKKKVDKALQETIIDGTFAGFANTLAHSALREMSDYCEKVIGKDSGTTTVAERSRVVGVTAADRTAVRTEGPVSAMKSAAEFARSHSTTAEYLRLKMNGREFPELPDMPIALITQVREDFLKVDLENTQALIEKCRAELKTIKDKKDKKVQAALRKKKRVDLVKGLGAGGLPHEKLHQKLQNMDQCFYTKSRNELKLNYTHFIHRILLTRLTQSCPLTKPNPIVPPLIDIPGS